MEIWNSDITEEQFVTLLNTKGRQSNVAYEDIRLTPKLKVTEKLSMSSVEQFTGKKQFESKYWLQLVPPIDLVVSQALVAVNVHDGQCNTKPVNDKIRESHPVEKDIESLLTNVTRLHNIADKDLALDLQMILKNVQNEIGLRQVTVSSLEFTHNWLTDDSIKFELDEN